MISNVDFFESRWKPPPERFEAGTPNFADAAALGTACDYLDAIGRDAIEHHDSRLASLAYEKLAELPGIRLLGPRPPQARGGLVSFSFPDVHAHDVVTFADQDGIALRGGHHCNQPLMRKLGLTGTARASFYIYNTEEEIDVLIASLRRILAFFR
jgi:cysteine desulfurase/selenocysteine lyase